MKVVLEDEPEPTFRPMKEALAVFYKQQGVERHEEE